MELNKNILDGISVAGNQSEVSDKSYNILIREIFEIAKSNTNLEGNTSDLDGCSEKIAHSSLLSLLLEAAKHDVDASSLSSLLEDCKWDFSRTSSFLNKFQENKEQIQSQLSMIGKSYDHIIDVKWRQDFVIKSNNCEKICEPSYIVSLKTWNGHDNVSKDVTFSCTMEQLQDLVLKLKDATKCIERNAV